MSLLALLIDALVDSALIAACFTAAMAALSGICIIGALYLCLKAIKDIVRVICGVPDPVVRREFIDADGRRGIEEIPYQPTMNLLTTAVQHGESMRRLN